MLILVRLGRTAVNAAGLLQGHADPPLDDTGRWQAERLAEALAPLTVGTAVVASPLRRAQATASAIAGPGLPTTTDERWIELDYGELDGVPVAEVPAATWATWRRDPDFRPPGGETLRELHVRVCGACDELVERAATTDVVVVSHVSPIKSAVIWALGGELAMSWRTRLDAGSITRIAIGPRGPSLQSFNETQHLRR